ncbi:hypothetical protein LJB85_02820 [Porphyromonadaceae bacterium OttesenSCG-928-L07]|nr:hypothetical protein [Porphyromonadaceae bacterium OttesenSCG-928-L07]MDL2252048.1 hypothetical protein [Odoribacter sp. OttesenSCG-928-J03]
MENKESVLKQLYSSDEQTQNTAIDIIKKEGDLSVVPELLDYIVKESHNLSVINILTDIKDSSFKSMLINRMQSEASPAGKAILLRICWESSLDFSEYADLFAKMLLEGPFEVALEASTILENLSSIEPDKGKEIIALLKKNKSDEQISFLVDNVIEYLTAP